MLLFLSFFVRMLLPDLSCSKMKKSRIKKNLSAPITL